MWAGSSAVEFPPCTRERGSTLPDAEGSNPSRSIIFPLLWRDGVARASRRLRVQPGRVGWGSKSLTWCSSSSPAESNSAWHASHRKRWSSPLIMDGSSPGSNAKCIIIPDDSSSFSSKDFFRDIAYIRDGAPPAHEFAQARAIGPSGRRHPTRGVHAHLIVRFGTEGREAASCQEIAS